MAKKLVGYDPQLADMRAQIAFFRSDFNECVQQALLLYPCLDEWYSGNKKTDTERMLEYALWNADADIKQEAIEILRSMYQYFPEQQLAARGFEHFRYIPQLIEHAEGEPEQFSFRLYTPPESPKELSAVIDEYLTLHKKRLAGMTGDPMENPSVIGSLLVSVKSQCRPEDYLMLYQDHCTAPELLNQHFSAAQIFLYLKQEDQAREALLNYARYGFIPVECTDVKPVSIFYDYSFVPLFNRELFDAIYMLPVSER